MGCSKKSDHQSAKAVHRDPRSQRRQLRLVVDKAILATYCNDSCGLWFEGTKEIRAGRDSGNHPHHPFHLTDEDTRKEEGRRGKGMPAQATMPVMALLGGASQEPRALLFKCRLYLNGALYCSATVR